jgi:TrmH family RNA methyltransferase
MPTITSTRNPRIIEARKLTQRKHRDRQNRFLVEGLQLLGMAVERIARPPSSRKTVLGDLFYCEELFAGEAAARLRARLVEAGAQPISVAPHVLDTLSDRDTSQGLAATFALRELEWSLDEITTALPSPRGLLLVLDRLQDPGNLGTLIRTADAVGADAVVMLEPCVDPFDPKSVRGTMGSIFTVPFARIADSSKLWPWLTEHGYRPIGADATRGQTAWNSNALVGAAALALGNEARGLSPDIHPHLVDYVSLPLLGHAESLNVAVAGGTLMYEWLRVNRRSG